MIDASTLRDLGWNEDLIAEVTRQADLLKGQAPDYPIVQLPFPGSTTATSHVFIVQPPVSASDRVHQST